MKRTSPPPNQSAAHPRESAAHPRKSARHPRYPRHAILLGVTLSVAGCMREPPPADATAVPARTVQVEKAAPDGPNVANEDIAPDDGQPDSDGPSQDTGKDTAKDSPDDAEPALAGEAPTPYQP